MSRSRKAVTSRWLEPGLQNQTASPSFGRCDVWQLWQGSVAPPHCFTGVLHALEAAPFTSEEAKVGALCFKETGVDLAYQDAMGSVLQGALGIRSTEEGCGEHLSPCGGRCDRDLSRGYIRAVFPGRPVLQAAFKAPILDLEEA